MEIFCCCRAWGRWQSWNAMQTTWSKRDLVDIPVNELVDLVSAGVHEADRSAPPSPGTPSPSVEGQQTPSTLGPLSKTAHCAPTTTNINGPEGGGGNIAGSASSPRLLWGYHWPLRKLSASSSAAGGPPSPATSLQLTLLARSFMWVNLKGSGKIYIFEWCKKQTSNQDSMVSHCFQEHLGICLVCPQCGINYLDPSVVCLNGRGIHNLLFY